MREPKSRKRQPGRPSSSIRKIRNTLLASSPCQILRWAGHPRGMLPAFWVSGLSLSFLSWHIPYISGFGTHISKGYLWSQRYPLCFSGWDGRAARRDIRNQQITKRERKMMEGRVLTSGFQRKRNADFIWVQYVLRSPSGKALCGRNLGLLNHFLHGQLPARGTRVLVLYLDDKNFQML